MKKTEIMASNPNNAWQIKRETVEIVSDFLFLTCKITEDGECGHEIRKQLLLGRKVITNLDSMLKSRASTLLTKIHVVKAMIFPVVTHGCENWTIRKGRTPKN